MTRNNSDVQGLSNRGAVIVWAALTALTLFSGALSWGAESGEALYGAALFLAAGFKSRIVVLYYMELRHAALAWRVAFEIWVFGTTAALIALFLISSPAG